MQTCRKLNNDTPERGSGRRRDTARERAIRLLAGREHGHRELTRKLIDRGFEPAEVERVVDELAESNLQSDARYAEMLSRARAGRGYGRRRVQVELTQAGVCPATINTALEAGDTDWVEVAVSALAKKFRNNPKADAASQQKQRKHLYARGFDSSEIAAAVKQFSQSKEFA